MAYTHTEMICIPLIIVMLSALILAIGWMELEFYLKRKREQAAEPFARYVSGTIAYFVINKEGEHNAFYDFMLVGNATIYTVESGDFSPHSHGQLTNPGDFVEFKILPGFDTVRGFYNVAHPRDVKCMTW